MDFTHKPDQIILYSKDHYILAQITFPEIGENTVKIDHTYVDPSLRGQGIAGQLMEEVVQTLREQHKTAVPTCSFAETWFERHPDAHDVLKK